MVPARRQRVEMSPYRKSGIGRFRLLLPVLALVVAACASMATGPSPTDRINHVVIIYEAKWSFDSLVRQASRPISESPTLGDAQGHG